MARPRLLNIRPVISNEAHFALVFICQKERGSCLGLVATHCTDGFVRRVVQGVILVG